MENKNHDYVTEYARAVYKGDILASKKNIKACERHLKDLKNNDLKYTFDVRKANRVIKFLELLPDPKTGKILKLAEFQKFIAGSLYGWVDDIGNRRFTKSYTSMSRKNGKTILISGLSLYEMLMGDEPVNERLVGLTANSREQATIAYDMVTAQLNAIRDKSAAIKDVTKITESKKEIINTRDRSKIKAVSNEASNLEGYQFSFAVIDEFHEAVNRKMFETLRRGQVLLNNPGLHIISTAGHNLSSPMFEEYEYVSKLLDGLYTNENYFVFIAEQDDESEMYDSTTWIKSNPLLEIDAIRPVLLRNVEAEVNEGVEKQDLAGLQVKNFNMWRQAGRDTYISYKDWRDCHTDSSLDIKGREVYIGIDMSRRDDLTAVGMVFPLDDDKRYVDTHVFVGHKGGIHAKSERDKIDYQKLVDTDMATLTDTTSGIINDQQVFEWIINYIEENQLDVQGIMYDPWSISNLLVRFEDYNYPLIEVKQNYMNLSEPLKQFKLDVFEKKIVHNSNPNLDMAINNAIVKLDNNGNIILNKNKNREKIDPIISVINAYTQAMYHEGNNKLEDYILSEDFGF